MSDNKIAITGWGSISPLGDNSAIIWECYSDNRSYFSIREYCGTDTWCGTLSATDALKIDALRLEKPAYKNLDPSVLYAMYASRVAVLAAGWNSDTAFGINLGSSRGATSSFEEYHSQFIHSGNSQVHPLTSPATTLGNIASWVAADLAANGPVISHSITCSTALHAILNAVAWLRSGLCSRFLAGGSEAALTAFTVAQMRALKIYSSLEDQYPCRSMESDKKQNSMILGEGAASFCLELNADTALAYITGVGYSTEMISHGASISAEGLCLQRAMQMAIKNHDPDSVDVLIMHAPGTVKGDASEMNAVEAVFGAKKPLLTSNKWKIGHTFGASGALSLEMALLMLEHDRFIQPPYLEPQEQRSPLKKILINAVGFGGNAVSILVEK
ncbi:beta-ketoacyl synthase [Pedobacter sp. BS3]|uniref:beta-ketoacyl synthase N-terminal-like domain-containing protein n=1 Tax=Pedobacter sp. BS3 TaxID=2567937 RepID=UPI0011EDECEB|nr:beta-ketoacyl synthase N-terminal-like domain-containing protein [Pedobacter sp. BS3]TZF81169.1 beta-ketoacyl synthase [Pedobacter sp. BS3]